MASITDQDGYAITDGLQGCDVCDEAVIVARRIARDRGEPVMLHDDDGDWFVLPDGSIERVE